MTLPVLSQLRQFLWSVALGSVLALLWVLLRALHTVQPRLTHFCDAVFSLILTPILLLFALYAGEGLFPVFFVPGILGGALLFLKIPGRYIEHAACAFFRIVFRFLHILFRLLRQFIRIFKKRRKKFFSFAKKSVMMDHAEEDAAAARMNVPGGNTYEIQTVVTADQTSHHTDCHRGSHNTRLPSGTAGRKGAIVRSL